MIRDIQWAREQAGFPVYRYLLGRKLTELSFVMGRKEDLHRVWPTRELEAEAIRIEERYEADRLRLVMPIPLMHHRTAEWRSLPGLELLGDGRSGQGADVQLERAHQDRLFQERMIKSEREKRVAEELRRAELRELLGVSPPEPEVSAKQAPAARCPFCHDAAGGDPCETCKAPMHAECWSEAGGACPSCGADRTPEPEPPAPEPPPAQEPEPPAPAPDRPAPEPEPPAPAPEQRAAAPASAPPAQPDRAGLPRRSSPSAAEFLAFLGLLFGLAGAAFGLVR